MPAIFGLQCLVSFFIAGMACSYNANLMAVTLEL